MKKCLSIILTVGLISFTLGAFANDIYITQVGDSLDLDIVQDGTDNVIGTDGQAVILGSAGATVADDMTFSITQTGNSNTIAAQIQGADYTGTWVFTGSSNTVDLKCDSGAAGNCATVTLNITATGDSQQYDIDIGESADASSSTVSFNVAGNGHVFDTDIDGVSAALAVTVTNNSSVISGGNTFDIDMAGDGDSHGHTQNLTVHGRGNTVSVDQSGIKDNHVTLSTTGDSGDIDITQSD
jgi:hypothetical protein